MNLYEAVTSAIPNWEQITETSIPRTAELPDYWHNVEREESRRFWRLVISSLVMAASIFAAGYSAGVNARDDVHTEGSAE